MSDIGERVKKIVVEHLGVEPDKVNDQASFIDDLGADSLDTVELVMAFEEEFSVEVPDEDAEKLQTVGDVIKYIEDKQVVLLALDNPFTDPVADGFLQGKAAPPEGTPAP